MKVLELQRNLEILYRLETQPSVEPFLYRLKSEDHPELLLRKEGDEYSLRVLIGERTLDAIEEQGLSNVSLQQFVNAAEEISHFTYLCWAIANEREVSLLDVELQGEIDKFLLAQHYFSAGTDLFHHLFERCFLKPTLTRAQRERYTEANRLGGKFCKAWMSGEKNLEDLRKFYRLSSQGRLQRTQKM